jgi:4-amino-4-deoxy-L-arabinose transferase-like glycosyltransferase
LVPIVAVGALLRFVPVWFGLPYMQARPDEDVAINLAVHTLTDLNPHFFHWPSLTLYLFAGAIALARSIGIVPDPFPSIGPEHFVLARVVVAAAGTVTLVVFFRLSRRVAGADTALIAAALLAVAILHVRESHFAMTDVLMTLLVTMSLGFLLRAIDESDARRALRWFAAAAVAGGLATSTKYNAAAVAASMGAAQLLVFARSPGGMRESRAWLPSIVYGILFVGAFLLATPYAVLDHQAFTTDVLFDITHLSGGHGVDLGRGWIYHLTTSLPHGVGVPVFVAALLGIVPFVRQYRREALVLGSFCATLYVSVGSGRTVFFRYVLPLIPVLCLVSAVGVQRAAAWLSSRARVSRTGSLVVVLSLTVGAGLLNCIWFDVLLARTDSRVIAARWLEEQLQPDHTLHDAGGPYVALDLSRSAFQRVDFDPATHAFTHAEGGKPDWLVLYQSPVSAYVRAHVELRSLASREYDLATSIRATRWRPRTAVYDLQDAFFMPVWGFWTVERPGPTIRIYRRRGHSLFPIDPSQK